MKKMFGDLDHSGAGAAPGLAARWCFGAAFLAFFAGTVALFFWGPWHYPIDAGRPAFVAFLVAVHVAFALGYGLAMRGRPHASSRPVRIDRLAFVALAIDVALLLPTSRLDTGHWLPQAGAALRDLAGAYTGSLRLRDNERAYVNYVRIVLAPVIAFGLPLGVFYWRRLLWRTRLLLAASVVGTIALFVAMGANAGAAHWMALFPWFVLAAHLSGAQRLTPRGWLAAAAVEGMSVALFAGLFIATMNVRTGSFAKHGVLPGIDAELGARSTAPAARGGSAPPTTPSPSAAAVGANGLAGYLTQGYFAVYLSLQQPFVPMYGVGNSVFLQRQAARLLHAPGILHRSYPERIQALGWNAYGYWATIYPWIASDVTFPGTVVVMGLIGWVAGLVWLDVLGGRNPFAVAFLGQILILLYYVPAHNKVMHSGEGVTAFWALCVLWVFTRTPASNAVSR